MRDVEEPPVLPFAGKILSTAARSAGLAAHRAAASARVDVLHSFLLLIGYLQSLPALGTWSLDGRLLAALQQMAPQVHSISCPAKLSAQDFPFP